MAEEQPSVIVLAGPNGSGKSTSAPKLLRDVLGVAEFVNADVRKEDVRRVVKLESVARDERTHVQKSVTQVREVAKKRQEVEARLLKDGSLTRPARPDRPAERPTQRPAEQRPARLELPKALAPHVPNRLPAGHMLSVCGTVLAGLHPDTGDLFLLVERLIEGQQWLRRHQRQGDQQPLHIALRQRIHPFLQNRLE